MSEGPRPGGSLVNQQPAIGTDVRASTSTSNIPVRALTPTRVIAQLELPQLLENVYGSSSLSLALPSGQREFGQYSEGGQLRNKDDEYESKSGSENMDGGSGEEQDPDQPPRKKRYHRHTPRQIQEMEMVFKECPHPDDKQRQELSKELGLDPRQVKFWFQNRRTQMKAQQERAENSMLRAQNEKLRAENIAMREALKNASCPNCGGPAALGEMSLEEQQLRIENSQLRDELDRVSTLAAKHLGRPIFPLTSVGPHHQTPRSTSLDLGVGGSFAVHTVSPSVSDITTRLGGLSDEEKPLVVELAMLAMEELLALAQAAKPLWTPDAHNEILNHDEYMRKFPRVMGVRPLSLKTEATRETGLVMINGVSLAHTLMDAEIWMNTFSCIVSRASTLEILSTGAAGTCDGALQLVLSPLVPTREVMFLRYCKQHGDGVWAIVDVSLDSFRDKNPSLLRCRRRPSGFIIQDMANGFCKVTVLEHMEYDDRQVHRMYKAFVNSGMAFGAQRWLATLQRECEGMASLLANNISPRDLGVIPSANGRRSMLKLAQRMTNNFCAGVSASTIHTWTTLSGTGEEDVRVMTRKSVDNPGEPHGIVLSAATSLWLPVLPHRVFDFLRDERLRSEWDILSNGGLVQEMAHIAKGQDPGNSVSLLRVNALNSSHSNMLILQESCTDVSGSLVVYAPVDIPAMNLVMQGGDPTYVALLPSGFAIFPDGPPHHAGRSENDETGVAPDSSTPKAGSLLTVAFQILVSNTPSAKLSLESVATVNNLISCTVQRIKAALQCETT
ncbi:hypothetical protein O6H91_22G009600 [Diphasiastrum complanatum]|uniref:Uncharacterized protein n=1 Tax=Diphasiastrum complanatum TaxID=34168 RepID=A0ACC2ACR2_DIPCM|nr:hypothetical protein O6H91_22G009600 [Diphasiastrum complanatum]